MRVSLPLLHKTCPGSLQFPAHAVRYWPLGESLKGEVDAFVSHCHRRRLTMRGSVTTQSHTVRKSHGDGTCSQQTLALDYASCLARVWPM